MARYPTEEACLEHMFRTRYGDTFACPSCGKVAKYHRVKKRRCYECEHCGHQEYPTAGTPFENTRTDLRDWFYVMYLFCVSRNGVSAKEVQRQLGVTYKTAWRMCRLIREYMGYVDGDAPLGGPGGGVVEADKAFIGGRDKRGQDDKTVVLGIVERGGEVITRVVPDRRETTIVPHMMQNIRPRTRVATDEAKAFGSLKDQGYRHGTVNHRKGEYVRGPVHTNNIEAFWGSVKRAIQGTYISVSPKYLPLYLQEFEFRYNLRKHPHLMIEALMLAFPKPARN